MNPAPAINQKRPWYGILYVQVLVAMGLGILVGYFFPQLGVSLKPLGDGFIKLVKMMIAPIIFCTVDGMPSACQYQLQRAWGTHRP